MKLNAIIINYNDAYNTIKFIDTIKDYNIINKIVVVDNLSHDDSLKVLNEYKNDKLIIIPNPVNSGYGEGINIGARYLLNHKIEGLLLICNNDIIIDSENDLIKMVNSIDRDTAIVAPVIKEHDILYYGWRLCTINEEIKMSLPFFYKKYEKKYRYYQEPLEYIDCVKGCMFIIDSEALKNVNYFDSEFFLYYEENVIGKKLKDFGYKTKLISDIVVIHNHSVTIDKSINRINKYKTLKKSHRLYCQKYLHANKLQMFILILVENIFLLGLRIKLLLKKGGN